MKKYFIPAALFAGTLFVNAQNYHLNITQTPDKVVTEGKLKLGGSNPDGHKIGINSYYMTIDGKPMIATMGEMHYSRSGRMGRTDIETQGGRYQYTRYLCVLGTS